MNVIINRFFDNGIQTIGELIILNGFVTVHHCKTLELPWKGNQNLISCIPKGIYQVEKRYSSKFKNHFHITGVPNRNLILIHVGNYYYQLEGCILVGDAHRDLDSDGQVDVTNSGTQMEILNKILPREFQIEIK